MLNFVRKNILRIFLLTAVFIFFTTSKVNAFYLDMDRDFNSNNYFSLLSEVSEIRNIFTLQKARLPSVMYSLKNASHSLPQKIALVNAPQIFVFDNMGEAKLSSNKITFVDGGISDLIANGVSQINKLASLLNTNHEDKNTFALEVVPREISLVGNNFTILPRTGFRISNFNVHSFSLEKFSLAGMPYSQFANLEGGIASKIPIIAEAKLLPVYVVANNLRNNNQGMVLGAFTSTVTATSNTTAVSAKKNLPFLDQLSLSLFCGFSSLSITVDDTRCNYKSLTSPLPSSKNNINLSGEKNILITPTTNSTTTSPSESSVNNLNSSLKLGTKTPPAGEAGSKLSRNSPTYITEYITKYITLEGKQGPAGQDGKNGLNGKDSTQSAGGFGGYITPTNSYFPPTPSVSLVGVSTISYLRDTTLEYAKLNYGTSTNQYLLNATVSNGVFNGGSLFNDQVTFTGDVSINNLTATNATTTSATTTNSYIANLRATDSIFTNSTTTNATITNLTNDVLTTNSLTAINASTTNATTTNSFLTNLNALNSTTTNFVAVNASTTNATTTNFFSANSFLTNGTSTNHYITNLSALNSLFTNSTTTNATSTNLYSTSATLANATSTNFFSTNSFLTNGTSTNHYITNLSALNSLFINSTTTNSSIASLIATNATSTNFFSTNSFLTNGTSTNHYITNLVAIDSLFTTSTTTNSFLTNATSTNLYSTSATLANATTTNFFSTNSFLTNGTSTNHYITNLSAVDSLFTNATTTNANITNLTNNVLTTNSLTATNGTTTNFFTTNLAVGTVNTTGNQTINGTLNVNGTTLIGSNTTIQGSVTLGTSTSNFITVNGLFNSNLTPAANISYDLGTPSLYWRNVYAGTVTANSFSAASTSISGTNSTSFSINSSNASTDMEDSSLVFFRGIVTPNAILRWNSLTKRLESNMSLHIENETPATGTTTFSIQSGQGQGAVNLFELRNNSGTLLTSFNSNGGLSVNENINASGTLNVSGTSTLATTTIVGTLTVNGNTNITQGGILTVGDKVIAPGEIGAGTSSPSGKISIQSTNANQVAFLIYGTSTQTAPLISVFDYPGSNQNIFSLSATGTLNTKDIFATSGAFSSTLNVLGNTTLANASTTNLSVSGILYAPTLSSTNVIFTNATSTNFFTSNLSSTNSTLTNATIGNASTTAISGSGLSFTNGFFTNLTTTLANFTGLTATNSTTTNATSTNFFSTNGTVNTFLSTLATITGLTVTNSTTTNAVITNASTTNLSADGATLTNLFSTNATLTNASTTNLSATGATLTNLHSTSATLTNASSSALTATNLYSTTANLGAITGTSFTGGTLSATTGAFTGAITGATSYNGLVITPNTGVVTTGTWNASQIANAYIATGLDVTKLTVGTTLPSNVVTSSLTTVGALASGSIASGFGTISTANTITGTTLNGTTGINTGATGGTQRIDASGNLVNIGTISSGAITSGLINGQTISSAANFTGSVAIATTLGVTGQTTLATASSTGLTVTGGTYLATTGGNVGIGTTAPVNLLNVVNSSGQNDAYGNLQIGYSGTATGANSGLTVKNYQGTSQFMQWDVLGLRLGSRIVTNTGAGNVYMTYGNDNIGMTMLGANGNVGIGDTTPTNKLDVTGAIGISDVTVIDASRNLTNIGTISSGAITSGLINGQTISSAANFTGTVTVAGNINLNDSLTTGKLAIGSFGSYLGRQSSDGSTILQTGQAHLLLNPTGGNVGIGTTSPQTTLAIQGADNSSFGQLNIQSTGSDARISLFNANGSSVTGRGDILMSRTAGYEGMRFMINNVDKMILDEGGNVGIGTVAPSGKLQVVGDTYFGSSAGTVGNLYLYGSTAGAVSTIATSNGNLHIDAYTGAYGTYLNYFRGTGGVYFGNGATGANASVSAGGAYTGTSLNLSSGTITSGLINGQTISSAANFTGTVTTAGNIISGGQISLPAANDGRKGLWMWGPGDANWAIYMGQPTVGLNPAGTTMTAGHFSNTHSIRIRSGSGFSVERYSDNALTMDSDAAGNLWALGAISAGSTITGTTLNGTTGINTGAGAGTQRIDASGNLANIGTISSGAITSGLINGQTISSAANFTGTMAIAGNTIIGGGVSDRRLDVHAGNDGITLGQDIDNTLTIQSYIDNQWAARTTYASGCCNLLKINPDVGSVQIGSATNPTPGLSVYGITTLNGALSMGSNAITSGLINGQTISSAANFTGTMAVGGTLTLSGATPQISLANGTSNWIAFNGAGVAAPTFNSSSAGTKIILYPNAGASASDFALGIESGTLWSSVPQTGNQFKWYGGVTQAMTLSGTGNLTLGSAGVGTLSAGVSTLTNVTLPNSNVAPTAGIYQGSGYVQIRGGVGGFAVNNSANTVSTLAITDAGLATFSGNVLSNGTGFYGPGGLAVQANDSWLRLNQNASFSNGLYIPGRGVDIVGVLRVNSSIEIGGAGSGGAGTTVIDASRNLVNIGTISSGAITSGLINGQTISSAANFTGSLTMGPGNFIQNITHGVNARQFLSAANNGGASGDANLVWWISEPGATWTGAGIARNMSNSAGSFPRINAGLTGQMMRFDEGTGIIFSTETSGGTRYNPLILDGNNASVGGTLTTGGTINSQTISSAANFTGTVNAATSVTTSNYLVNAGNGNGLCFWTDCSNYKVSMANSADYIYGPVTDYSIKTTMSNTAGRGWTWGTTGIAPIAAINTAGTMQIAGNFTTMGTITSGLINGQTISSAANFTGTLAVSGRALATSLGVASSFGDVTNNSPWYGIGMSNVTLPGGGTTAVQVAGWGGLNLLTGSGQISMTSAGNVGIGTASPDMRLNVVGASNAPDGAGTTGYGVLSVGGTSGASDAQIRMGFVTANRAWIQTYGGKPLYINELGNNVVLNSGGGNTGIGVSPTSWAKLDVNGDMSVRGGSGTAWITSEAGGLPIGIKSRGGTNYDLVVATNGNVGVGTNGNFAKFQVKATQANTDQTFSVASPLVLADGISLSSSNDANTANKGMEFNASQYVFRVGNLGIGTGASPSYVLQVNGQPAANGYTAFTNYSDARLKNNVTNLITDGSSALAKIVGLRPVTFNYNSLTGYSTSTQARRTSGFIAQELQQIFPEMVGTTTINGNQYFDTNLSDLPLYLINATQELNNITLQSSSTLSNFISTTNSNFSSASSSLISLSSEFTSSFLSASSSIASLSDTVTSNQIDMSLSLNTLASTVNTNHIEFSSSTSNILTLLNNSTTTLSSQISNITDRINLTNGKLNSLTLTSLGTVGIGNDGTSLGGELLRVSGRIRATGFDIDNAADIAENFPASEAVDSGTVVAFSTNTVEWSTGEDNRQKTLDNSNTNATSTASSTVSSLMSNVYNMSTVRKALNGYEAVGVISTNSGIVLGSNTPNGVPVAFSGRVPVKVTTENGEIKQGDYLTVSLTMPGYAMKLTGEGRSIGRALSDYEAGRDRVLMLVENGNQKLDITGKNATTTGMLTLGNIDLNANGVSIINIKSLASANGTWSIDEEGRIVAKSLAVETLCVGTVCVTQDQFLNMIQQTNSGTSSMSSSATVGMVAGTSTTGAVSSEQLVVGSNTNTTGAVSSEQLVVGSNTNTTSATTTTSATDPILTPTPATAPIVDTPPLPVVDPIPAPIDTTVAPDTTTTVDTTAPAPTTTP